MTKRVLETSLDFKRSTHRSAKHGLSNHSIYHVWLAMKSRCYKKTDPNYQNYGGRGIKICDEWKDVTAFFDWAVKNGYSIGKDIDRVDNDGPYSPLNCRFTTRAENQNNKRVTRRYEYNGEVKSFSQWAAFLDISHYTLEKQLKNGRTIGDIIQHGLVDFKKNGQAKIELGPLQLHIKEIFHDKHLLKISKIEKLAKLKDNRLNYHLMYGRTLTDAEATKVLKVLKDLVIPIKF